MGLTKRCDDDTWSLELMRHRGPARVVMVVRGTCTFVFLCWERCTFVGFSCHNDFQGKMRIESKRVLLEQ